MSYVFCGGIVASLLFVGIILWAAVETWFEVRGHNREVGRGRKNRQWQ
jgi:hypothetical protein